MEESERAPRILSDFSPCPREESNLRTRFRKPLLYPLSYEGKRKLVQTRIVGGSGRDLI